MISLSRDPFLTLQQEAEIYRVEVTGTTRKYVTDLGDFMYQESMPLQKKYLGIASHLRSRAKKLRPFIEPEIGATKFIDYSLGVDSVTSHERVVEIDVVSAYWVAAYRMGLIDKERFAEYYGAKGQKKLARNIAIGQMASRKDIFSYCEYQQKLIYEETEVSENIEVWRKLTGWFDSIMKFASHMAQNSFLFYWVDAVFLLNPTPQDEERVKAAFELYGFEHKTINLQRVLRTGREITTIAPGKSPKTYTLPKRIGKPT